MLLNILLQFPFHILNYFNLKRALGYESQSAVIQPKTPEVTDNKAAKTRAQVLARPSLRC